MHKIEEYRGFTIWWPEPPITSAKWTANVTAETRGLLALALLCASIASASAGDIRMGPEFHPPKGYVEPTNEQLARTRS